MRKQVDKAQGALPCFLVSLFPLFPYFPVSLFPSFPSFPCFPVSLSTYLPVYQSKNTPPPAYCQGRGVEPRGTTLLEPENRPRSVAVAFTGHSTPDNGGVSGANYYVSRSHVSRFTFTFCSPNSPAHSSASWLPRSHPRRLSEARFAATCPVHSRSYFDWREYATAVRGCQTNRLETALCPVPRLSGELPRINKCCRLWICRPNDLFWRPGDSSVIGSDRSSRPLRT